MAVTDHFSFVYYMFAKQPRRELRIHYVDAALCLARSHCMLCVLLAQMWVAPAYVRVLHVCGAFFDKMEQTNTLTLTVRLVRRMIVTRQPEPV